MSEAENKCMTEIQEKQLSVIEHYGVDNQLDQLIEESAELILAIRKYKRSVLRDPVGLINELADVLNLIEQIRLKDEFIDNGVSSVKEYKVNREIDRIRTCTIEAWKLAQE